MRTPRRSGRGVRRRPASPRSSTPGSPTRLPVHPHDAWTLLIVDDGAVRFDNDRTEHGALTFLATLLPPHVPHDGRAATPLGFRERVLHLDARVLGEDLVGASVDSPGSRTRSGASGSTSCTGHSTARGRSSRRRAASPSSGRGRYAVEAGPAAGPPAAGAAGRPCRRRADPRRRRRRAARDPGTPGPCLQPGVGFSDQPHLTRHFIRMLGATPARYAASGSAGNPVDAPL
ncbi:AraC family ligand binding domain-containing protein [Pseudonocardia sp. T1-2H]|uniref:AraC family ligand binding domain-containing protein n=1 Tax=Pseudonocardia sp. T1-2H TaxID=3128899 RepID=UPI0031010EF2